MKYEEIVSALEQERDLLQQLSILSEQQLEHLRAGDLDSFGIIWPLRAEPMDELMRLEETVAKALDRPDTQGALGWRERAEIRSLNTQISDIATSIAAMDAHILASVQIESPESLNLR